MRERDRRGRAVRRTVQPAVLEAGAQPPHCRSKCNCCQCGGDGEDGAATRDQRRSGDVRLAHGAAAPWGHNNNAAAAVWRGGEGARRQWLGWRAACEPSFWLWCLRASEIA